MRYLICFVLLSSLSIPSLRAQDATERIYTLRDMTLEEYTALIPSFYNYLEYEQIPSTIFDVLEAEILHRFSEFYDPNGDFLFQITAYNADYQFEVINRQYLHYWEHLFMRPNAMDHEYWRGQLLILWLNENEVNLSDEALTLNTNISWGYAEETIIVTPRDFNADGQNDFVLHLADGNYIVLGREASTYYLISTPLVWSDVNSVYWEYTSGYYIEQNFGDITGDSIPEWQLLYTGVGGNGENHGELFILGWQNGELIQLVDQRLGFVGHQYCDDVCGTTWVFSNTDQDQALEITYGRVSDNDWGCPSRSLLFDWNGTMYVSRELPFTPTMLCYMLDAERAMWDHRYLDAIDLYEQALAMRATSEMVEHAQYGMIRLAIAYALVGREADAGDLLAQLQQEQPVSDMIRTLLNAMLETYSQTPSAIPLCTAAYGVFYEMYIADQEFDTAVLVGMEEYPGPNIGGGRYDYPPAPERAGCDLPALLAQSNNGDPVLISPSAGQAPQWDAENLVPTVQALEATSTPVITVSSYTHFSAGQQAFAAADYTGALAEFDQALTLISEDVALAYTLGIHYWRALTLEALGQEDEALNEYVAVIEGGLTNIDLSAETISVNDLPPEYYWYELAVLHVVADPPIIVPTPAAG